MEIKAVFELLNNEFSLISNQVKEVNETDFFKKESDEKWSVAENLHHLSLSLLPINNLLKQPELMLERWGHSNRKSREIGVFLEDYKKAVANADWKAFPPFIPKSTNEPDDYMQKHATTTQSKLTEFYQFTGNQIMGLREKIQLNSNSTKNDILDLFQSQYKALFFLAEQLTDVQMDELQIPLPYAGLITCKEMMFFTYNHTKVHRLAIDRLII